MREGSCKPSAIFCTAALLLPECAPPSFMLAPRFLPCPDASRVPRLYTTSIRAIMFIFLIDKLLLSVRLGSRRRLRHLKTMSNQLRQRGDDLADFALIKEPVSPGANITQLR